MTESGVYIGDHPIITSIEARTSVLETAVEELTGKPLWPLSEDGAPGDHAKPRSTAPELGALCQRVAALETALALPAVQAPEQWTDGQVEEFKAGWHRLASIPGARWLPPGPVLTREVVEAAVRECVTVVKPGETLVIRCRDWTPDQAEQCTEYFRYMAEAGEIPFRPLVVIGDELAVVRPEPDNSPDNQATPEG